MKIRILTYADPYKLNKAHFWPDIQDAPHLCAAQTMVNGLMHLYGNQFNGLCCTVDRVLGHFYGDWATSKALYIDQYSALSREINQLKSQMSPELFQAMKFNQRYLLEAIRLLAELGVSANSLSAANGTLEQKTFVKLLEQVSTTGHVNGFRLSVDSTLHAVCRALNLVIDDLSKREEGREETLDESRITKWQINLRKSPPKQIVFHGIHKFSPLMLDFISRLSTLNIDVVFLWNFQPSNRALYDTWTTIYDCFEAPLESDRNFPEYNTPALSQSQQLGVNYAELLAGQPPSGQLPRVDFFEFDNMTEFANYVASEYERGEKRNAKNPLKGMKEHFYAPSSDANDLLRMYFPKQFGERHFLAYPIGQFFLGLYSMWNETKSQIEIEPSALKQCLNAQLIQVKNVNRLLSFYERAQLYYRGADDVSSFLVRADQHIHALNNARMNTQNKDRFERVPFFGPGVEKEDIEGLKECVQQLQVIAEHLFKDNGQGTLSFRVHFQRLLDMLRTHSIGLQLDAEEQEVVDQLIARFDNLGGITTTGSFEDVKSGLFYYLKQVEDKDQSASWIVRNFEQIDGDILRSVDQDHDVIYHFAGLSDENLHHNGNEILPWPLSIAYLDQTAIAQDFKYQVYISSKKENSRFARYAFYYGLIYNQRRVRLSYVKNVNEEKTQPYFVLGLLGIDPTAAPGVGAVSSSSTPFLTGTCTPPGRQAFDINQARSFALCPYRFLLEYILDNGGVFEGDLQVIRYYEVLLAEHVWRNVAGRPLAFLETGGNLLKEVNRSSILLEDYFPFLRQNIDSVDINMRVANYIRNWCVENGRIKPLDANHMERRRQFIHSRMEREGVKENILYPYLYQTTVATVSPQINQYLRQPVGRDSHVDIWCKYCKTQLVCLEMFRSLSGLEEIAQE